jgi:hypothetical protein
MKLARNLIAVSDAPQTALEEHKAVSIGKHSVVAAGLSTAVSLAIEFHDHIGNAVRSLFK